MPDGLIVILGNQLFDPAHLARYRGMPVYLSEDLGLCTYVRHHQQKLVLFLSAMRHYAQELEAAGFEVIYRRLDDGRVNQQQSYVERLLGVLRRENLHRVIHFEIEDRQFEAVFQQGLDDARVAREVLPSPMFLTSRQELARYFDAAKKPFMARFYQGQRRRLDLLMEAGKPRGGRWSFDTDNRKALPRDHQPPEMRWFAPDGITTEVIELVEQRFADHPGRAADFAWPVTRAQAHEALQAFISERLCHFGDYEDAISRRSPTLYHSLLTPPLNLGLLEPGELVEAALAADQAAPVGLNNLEGWVRQVIGWREFIRGIDRHHGERQASSNFFGHQRQLTDAWYQGETGIPPLDDAIKGAQARGWNHHIERLMVIGNLMNLAEIAPGQAYRWFMEMYVDSSDWVMGPNVYGMALFSDGGIFATKPYICGANYLRKMSDYPAGNWCDVVDGLYWRFVDKNHRFLSGNPRLNMMLATLGRMDAGRRGRIFTAAEAFLARHTHTG